MGRFSKFISLVLCLAIVLSSVSCAKKNKKHETRDEQEELPIISKVDDSLDEYFYHQQSDKKKVAREVDLLCEAITNQESYESIDDNFFDYEIMYGSEKGTVFNAISSTLSLKLNSDIKIDKLTSGAILEVSMADYDSVFENEDNLVSIDALVQAIESADLISFEVPLQLVFNNGKWEIIDVDSALDRILPFLDSEFEIYNPHVSENLIYDQAYIATIDYTGYFAQAIASSLGTEVTLSGNLDIHLQLIVGEEQADVSFAQEEFMTDLQNYVQLNTNVLVEASTGMSVEAIKLFTGMTDEDLYNTVMETVMAEINTIDFSIFSMSGPYEINGETITINTSNNQGDLVGTILGGRIALDITSYQAIDNYITENIIVFELT